MQRDGSGVVLDQIVVKLEVEGGIPELPSIEDDLVGSGQGPILIDDSQCERHREHEGIEDRRKENEGIVHLPEDDGKLVVFVDLGPSPKSVDELELVVVHFVSQIEERAVVLIVDVKVIESQNSSTVGPIHTLDIGVVVQIVQICVKHERTLGVLDEVDDGLIPESGINDLQREVYFC